MGNKLTCQVLSYAAVARVIRAVVVRQHRTVEEWKRSLKLLAWAAVYSFVVGSPQHPLLFTMFGIRKPKVHVDGFVAPGFEPVKKLFTERLVDGMEHGAQCAVYLNGKLVVDLCGSQEHKYRGRTVHYGPRTLQNVFSSGKMVTSLALAMAIDRGYFKYEDKICDIWPEFAKNGKQDIRIVDVLKHESGMFQMSPLPVEHFTRDGMRENHAAVHIENTPPYWHDETERAYHAVTRGWILNEVFRRRDPAGRTIGEFVQQDIAKPLGCDFHFGLPDELAAWPESHAPSGEDFDLVAPVENYNILWSLLQSIFVPECLGRKVPFNGFWSVRHILDDLYNLLVTRKGLPFVSPFDTDTKVSRACLLDDFNHPSLRSAEMPSGNGHSNAVSMAKIAACLCVDHKVGDAIPLLSPEGRKLAHANHDTKYDKHAECKTKLSNAGFAVFDHETEDDRGGFVGWMGYGGSCLQWHPEKHIGFGYAMNCIATDINNATCSREGFFHMILQRQVLACVEQLEETGQA